MVMLKNSKSKFVYYGLAWIPPLTLKKRYNVKQKVQGFYHTGLLTECQWKKKKLLVKNLYCIIINIKFWIARRWRWHESSISKSYLDPLTSKSGWLLIYPYSIILESNVEAPDCHTNSPCQKHGTCKKNSSEKIDINAMV